MVAGIVAIILSGCAVLGLIVLAGIIHYILEDIVNLIMIIDPECAKRVRFSDMNIEEKYPCTLIINATYDTSFTGTAYDFSEYESKKIIGMTVCNPKNSKYKDYFDEEGNFCNVIVPNQTVCKMKDGNYIWMDAL